MKTPEAKPFDQNAEKLKTRKSTLYIDRARGQHIGAKSRPAHRGKIESVRTHSEVIKQFDLFSLLKLLFLVRNWHCWSRKAFTREMTPKAEKKLRRRRFFDTADRHEKFYGRSRLYASTQGRHETGGVFSLFSSLTFDISIKTACRDDLQTFKACFV